MTVGPSAETAEDTSHLAINTHALHVLLAPQVAIANKDPPGLNPKAPIAWDKKNKMKKSQGPILPVHIKMLEKLGVCTKPNRQSLEVGPANH